MTTTKEYGERWARLNRILNQNSRNLEAVRQRIELDKQIDARFNQIFSADSPAMSRLAADVLSRG